MILFMVAAAYETGRADALERGWKQIATHRFVTADRDDVRLITRFRDMIPGGGQTPFIRAKDYETGPDDETEEQGKLKAWIKEKEQFDQFVQDGSGIWIDPLELRKAREPAGIGVAGDF